MRRHFDERIAECNSRLIHMGKLVRLMVDKSLKALLDRNPEGHEEVFQHEEETNELHIEIDERVIKILALEHPVAADLRLLLMASKMASELERIGDQAVNICQHTAALLQRAGPEPLANIQPMADVVCGMLTQSLEAFERRAVELAQNVLDTDDKVDAFKDQIFLGLLGQKLSQPDATPRALLLVLISRSLERIADHATNIAEEVIYAAQGRDVRHHHDRHHHEKMRRDESQKE